MENVKPGQFSQDLSISKVPGVGGVGVGVGVGVTTGVGVTATAACTFLLWFENPVTELSLPNVCSPTLELLHLPSLRQRSACASSKA